MKKILSIILLLMLCVSAVAEGATTRSPNLTVTARPYTFWSERNKYELTEESVGIALTVGLDDYSEQATGIKWHIEMNGIVTEKAGTLDGRTNITADDIYSMMKWYNWNEVTVSVYAIVTTAAGEVRSATTRFSFVKGAEEEYGMGGDDTLFAIFSYGMYRLEDGDLDLCEETVDYAMGWKYDEERNMISYDLFQVKDLLPYAQPRDEFFISDGKYTEDGYVSGWYVAIYNYEYDDETNVFTLLDSEEETEIYFLNGEDYVSMQEIAALEIIGYDPISVNYVHGDNYMLETEPDNEAQFTIELFDDDYHWFMADDMSLANYND